MSYTHLIEYLEQLKHKEQEYCQFNNKSLPITVLSLFDTLVKELFDNKLLF